MLLRRSPFALLPGFMILMPFLILGAIEQPSFSKGQKKEPAYQSDLYLYRVITGTLFCTARSAGMEFPKAGRLAAITQVDLIDSRHEGVLSNVGKQKKQKLSRKQLFGGAEISVIQAGIQYCPEKVPDDVKAKLKELEEKVENEIDKK